MQKMIKAALVITALTFSACSPEAPKLIPKPTVVNDKVSADSDSIVFTPKVDILFVIDNSGSMGAHQMNLANNIDQFVGAFSSTVQIDYNIGVVTTDMEDFDQAGKLQGSIRFVNNQTPNGLKVIANNIKALGTQGDWQEKSFDPIVAALSDPLVQTHNAGFLRRDAHLAIVLITDAEDQSEKHNPISTYDFLVTLKGTKDKVLSYGVIVPSGVSSCERDEVSKYPRDIENFLSLPINTGKNVMSLCDPNYGVKLADLSKDIAKYVGGVIYLNRAPVLSTIKVLFGTQVIPPGYKTGWTFDPEKNAIILGDEIVWTQQPAGTKLQVLFEAAQYQTEK